MTQPTVLDSTIFLPSDTAKDAILVAAKPCSHPRICTKDSAPRLGNVNNPVSILESRGGALFPRSLESGTDGANVHDKRGRIADYAGNMWASSSEKQHREDLFPRKLDSHSQQSNAKCQSSVDPLPLAKAKIVSNSFPLSSKCSGADPVLLGSVHSGHTTHYNISCSDKASKGKWVCTVDSLWVASPVSVVIRPDGSEC
jgi:hypothetical protein